MPTYYDLVLGLIPLAVLGGIAAGSVARIAMSTAAGVASLLAVMIIAHALFINPPATQRPQSAGDRSPPTSPRSATEGAKSPAEFAD